MTRSEGWWQLEQRDRDVVGHHRPAENRVVMNESWTVMYKFDEVARRVEDFQERCDEYQTYLETMILSFIPIVIIKVGMKYGLSQKDRLISLAPLEFYVSNLPV